MIGCIIQARMGSSRLPGKALMKSDSGKPLLYYVTNQLRYCSKVKNLVIATTTNQEDDEIEKFANNNSINVFRGKEKDVLDRYFQCAKKHSFSTIVRITADCPLIDPQIVDKVIEQFFSENCDFATNTLTRTFPIGTDVEVFSFSALNKAWENAQLPSEREHVTPYFHNKENFKIINVENDKNISNLRLTVDRIEDFELIKQILNNISINPIHLEDVLELFSRKPELIEINKHINHNEGFNKSLEEDKEFIKKQKR
ncbi:glycosyltransferase family protein [Marine Group I thaumarchaeote]|uniref:Glycosyltransferase family protein n=1 Tax=Marine Group I thaumarchaeote TaxID=2511932 RepID=A0A7K4NTF6_9ARCH|nr:glycosyltransferase family protein [Marine Group I thaumarchaeote]